MDEVKTYLQGYQFDFIIEGHGKFKVLSQVSENILVQKAIENVESLRELGLENLLKRFDTIYRMYTEFISIAEQSLNESPVLQRFY